LKNKVKKGKTEPRIFGGRDFFFRPTRARFWFSNKKGVKNVVKGGALTPAKKGVVGPGFIKYRPKPKPASERGEMNGGPPGHRVHPPHKKGNRGATQKKEKEVKVFQQKFQGKGKIKQKGGDT